MITAYHPDEEGRLIPEIPKDGPCRGWDERPCRLSSDHDRERKTGPCFPLRVMRCLVHGHGFTLYPPGHFPYGRKRLAAVAWEGSPEQSEEKEREEPGTGGGNEDDRGLECFRGTYFEAMLDAAAGQAWPQRSYEGSLRERFSTQMRQLRRGLRLLGAAPELGERQRERIGSILGVSGQTLEDAVRGLEGATGYRRLGQAGVRVLAVLPGDGSLWQRLAESGALLGQWPAPRVCPGRGRALRPTPFRMPGTRPPPEAR